LNRESKGAGVNDVPGARQSRDLARPQARIPVRVTKKHLALRGVFLLNRESKGAGVNDVPGARQSRDLARPQARIPVRVGHQLVKCFCFLSKRRINIAQGNARKS